MVEFSELVGSSNHKSEFKGRGGGGRGGGGGGGGYHPHHSKHDFDGHHNNMDGGFTPKNRRKLQQAKDEVGIGVDFCMCAGLYHMIS